MAAAGGPTETGAAANGVSPSIPLRHVKVAVIGVGGLFHECLVDWQVGLAHGPKHEHYYDPTQPEAEQHIVIDDRPCRILYETMELFTDRFSLNSPYWVKYHKPGLKKWLGETDACVLVYSCTHREAFDLLVQAWDEVRAERLHSPSPTCKQRFVVHDNIDIDPSEWEVSLVDGQHFSRRIRASFHPLSSRTGKGAEGFGSHLVQRVLELPQDHTSPD